MKRKPITYVPMWKRKARAAKRRRLEAEMKTNRKKRLLTLNLNPSTVNANGE